MCVDNFTLLTQADNGRESIQKNYFSFVIDLLKWAAKSQAKISEKDDREEIYFKYSEDEYKSLSHTFEKHRLMLCKIRKAINLNKIGDIYLLPEDLHSKIIQNFSLKKCDEEINSNQILAKIVGKKLRKNSKEIIHYKGFLDSVSELDMNEWDPIRDFITKLKATGTIDPNLSDNLGKFLLPLFNLSKNG